MYLLKGYLSLVKQVLKRQFNLSNSSNNYQDLPDSYLSNILNNWNVEQINFKKNLGGSSAANWLLETPKGKYVLRNAGANRQYIDFQLLVINKLAESNFGYSIPQPLPAKGTYYVQEQDHFWLLYRFIESRPLGAISNKTQARNIGTVVASYHKIAQEINFSSYRNYFNLQIFNEIDAVRMESFIKGYFKALQLSQNELYLIYPFMIDRLTDLLADILEEGRIKKSGYKDTLAIFLINLLT